MATLSWKTAVSGTWTEAANWSPAAVPGPGDDVLIAAAGSYLISVAGATVNSLTLNDSAATLLSSGTLTVNAGLVLNQGTLAIATGSVVALGPFSNTGTVIDTGSLLLFGGYDAESIERIGGSGGTLQLASSLANAGGTLDGSGLAGLTIHGIGTILGGAVVGLSRPGAATLDGVTWRGPLHEDNTHLTIRNGLQITGEDGSTPGTIDINGATVVFAGTQSFDHAEIAGRGAIYANDTLTLGAAARVSIADFGLLSISGLQPANGLISNAGLIEVIGQPRFPSDQGVEAMISFVDFENTGTLATAGTGGLASDAFIAIDSSKIANHSGAMLAAFGGRVAIGSGSVLTNDGTIEADAGTVQIGGLLQGSGRVEVTNGGVVEFGGAVAPTQSIDLVGSATLTLDQPAFFMGRIDGFAVGDAIKLGVSATPVSYAAGDLQLKTAQSQTFDLHIDGPFSLADFMVSASGVLQVNGVSPDAPVISALAASATYPASAAAVTLAGDVVVSDRDSPALTGATIAITGGAVAGDFLSADPTGSLIQASFNPATDVLTLAGPASLADYQRVLASVAFGSGAADPTNGTTRVNRTVTWVVNDGSMSSAPVTSAIAVRPPSRQLTWTGAADRSFGNAANWTDATFSLSPALLSPDAADSVVFDTGGGSLEGTAKVAGMTFGGGQLWHVGSNTTLTATGSVDIAANGFAALAITDGGTLNAGALKLGGTGDGVLTLAGADSLLSLSGSLIIGGAASAELSILNGAVVSATDASLGLSAGASGNVDIEGAGSHLDVAGDLIIGLAGTGVLTLGNHTELTVGRVLTIGASGVLNQFGGVIDPEVISNTGEAGGMGRLSADTSIINTGTLFAHGGSETLVAPVIHGTGMLAIGAAGDLVLNVGSVAASQKVRFADGTGVLTIGTLAGFAATIDNYLAGDAIVVADTTVAATHFDSGTHVLTLFDGTSQSVGTLRFGASVTDGSIISVNGVTPCFVAGTRISTERGEIAVEELQVGDMVQVVWPPSPCGKRLGGRRASSPVIWLGQRTLDCSRHPAPRKIWPVRVAAHAFGPGRPARDLWLSPDHALYVAEVLIPVNHLINGSSIAQVPSQQVTYWHVELPRHSVLLAEGLPVESYLDAGNRTNFANNHGPVTLYPDFSTRTWEAEGCAPLVVTGAPFAAVRNWISSIAARIAA